MDIIDLLCVCLRESKRAASVFREKELLKEKRRKRQELFREQKKRKFLPADVLEVIEPAAPKKQKSSEDEAEEEQEDEEEDCDELERDHKTTTAKNLKLSHVRKVRGNYIVTTGKEAASSSVQQQAAMDFLQSRLYGPGSCRTTSNELLSLQNKKGRNKSAAVQFVKKDWACKEKAKAEKLKRRWIHKQQVPSS
ncbi:U3 small nucleolar RNA-associated protein NOL7 isoform X2 [Genypterus blacodes]|uniref:U3 small nucleolar RNA-associated protein NOL7 isoform X2 n=1 Tax=Genypterus blacodes TaxID=154954 RepID=UPI003F768655